MVFDFAGAVVRFAVPRGVLPCTSSLHDSHQSPVQLPPVLGTPAHAITVRRSPPTSLDALAIYYPLLASHQFSTGGRPTALSATDPTAISACCPEIVTDGWTEFFQDVILPFFGYPGSFYPRREYGIHFHFLGYQYVHDLEDSEADQDQDDPEHDQELATVQSEEIC